MFIIIQLCLLGFVSISILTTAPEIAFSDGLFEDKLPPASLGNRQLSLFTKISLHRQWIEPLDEAQISSGNRSTTKEQIWKKMVNGLSILSLLLVGFGKITKFRTDIEEVT
jgi:hypothetical protein